jgi:hypothetical protein
VTTTRKKQITAQLNANMPAGTTLTATLAAPAGATSVGAIALTTTAQALVINIPRGIIATHSITYQFSATAAAGVIPNTSRTVTLTLINYP